MEDTISEAQVILNCSKCGKPIEGKYGSWNICRECRHKYFKNYNRRRLEQAVKLFGGRCERCGIDNPLVLRVVSPHSVGYILKNHASLGKDAVRILCLNCYKVAKETGEL